jgi:hypothetical protein
MSEVSAGRILVPTYLLGPTLRSSIAALYGGSREARVIHALLSSGPLTLAEICRRCLASERAIRNDGRTGWIRAILNRYREAGILTERDTGNRITYELVESAPAVVLLRELQNRDPV